MLKVNLYSETDLKYLKKDINDPRIDPLKASAAKIATDGSTWSQAYYRALTLKCAIERLSDKITCDKPVWCWPYPFDHAKRQIPYAIELCEKEVAHNPVAVCADTMKDLGIIANAEIDVNFYEAIYILKDLVEKEIATEEILSIDYDFVKILDKEASYNDSLYCLTWVTRKRPSTTNTLVFVGDYSRPTEGRTEKIVCGFFINPAAART